MSGFKRAAVLCGLLLTGAASNAQDTTTPAQQCTVPLMPGGPTSSKLLYVPGVIPDNDADKVNWTELGSAKGAWEDGTHGCGAAVPEMRIESDWDGLLDEARILGMRALGWHVVRVNVIARPELGTYDCAIGDRDSFNINRNANCGDSRESTVYRHEMGHNFGLADIYDGDNDGAVAADPC